MSGTCVFIGDELSAAGYRLAGVACHTPASAELSALLRRLRADGDTGLILLTAEFAAGLPEAELAEALAVQHPPLLVISDIRGRQPPPNTTAAIRRQLGLAE